MLKALRKNNLLPSLTKLNAKIPLGEKNSNIVYNIPCKCGEYAYTGETQRKWKTRRKEQEDKVQLTLEDM